MSGALPSAQDIRRALRPFTSSSFNIPRESPAGGNGERVGGGGRTVVRRVRDAREGAFKSPSRSPFHRAGSLAALAHARRADAAPPLSQEGASAALVPASSDAQEVRRALDFDALSDDEGAWAAGQRDGGRGERGGGGSALAVRGRGSAVAEQELALRHRQLTM